MGFFADSFSDLLTQVATIEVRAPTRNGYVSSTLAWNAVAAGVPCLVRPLKVQLLFLEGRDPAMTWTRIYFAGEPIPGGVDLRHRVRVEGRFFAVQGQLDVNSEHDLYHVDCIEVRE